MSKVNDRQRGFVEGTVVLMASGHLKPIEKIVPGDAVKSFDTRSADSALEPREVIDVFKYISRDVLEVKSGEDSLMVTPGQLFLTPGMDWTFAHETAYILDEDGNDRSFEVKKVNAGKQRIYDIIVDDNHSLIANGFRVHNETDVGGRAMDATQDGSRGAGFGGLGDRSGSLTGSSSDYSSRAPTGSASSGGGSSSGPRGSYGFANGDEGGFRTSSSNNNDSRGNDNGGRGDRDTSSRSPIRSSRGSRSRTPAVKKPPPIDRKAQSYAAYNAISDTMDYICDIMVQSTTTNFFTVRTAAFRYMAYARALAADALNHANASDMGLADKNNMALRNEDLVNGFKIIEDAFKGDPNQANANIELISRACLNNKMWIDMLHATLSKYIGADKTNITYSLPGFNPPAKVNLQSVPVYRAYVQTAPGIYVTTQESPIGTTTVQPTTGGLGASYTKTRVVRGFLYSYTPGKGWSKVGPADQYRSIG